MKFRQCHKHRSPSISYMERKSERTGISTAKRKGVFEHAQTMHSDSYRACAMFHSGVCSPLMYSIVSNNFVSIFFFFFFVQTFSRICLSIKVDTHP